ncbi:MAG: HAMP domain-containing sensor histidine kinase [Clostridium sp.]|uniref:sensor histidine kinase n=1 Tax=Clostridium sp. TaxID=1506 RepID=UPI002FCAC2A3
MKKSLFSKLMSTYFIVIVISYIVVSVFLSVWFYEYYYSDKKKALITEGSHVKTVVQDYASKKINKTDMMMQISTIENLTDTKISVYDNYGYIVGAADTTSSEEEDIFVSKEELQRVMKGEEIVRSSKFSDIFSSYVMTVGMPIEISNNVTFSVFLNSSLVALQETLKNVFLAIWTSAFLAIIVCAFIVYYISERILINPLSSINKTARQIASGEFNNRVNIKSSDEIGVLADSFNSMADSLENLENMRRSFIGNVSHELRTPMTSINGFVEGMIDGTIDKDNWEKYLRVVNGESKRLMRIINDLLDLAKLESGEFSMNMGHFQLNELISECVIKFEERINQKNLDIKIILLKEGVIAKGDRDRINQVITNLLDNAIKFARENGAIEIMCEARGEKVFVSIFNTSEPIPREEIKYIWERFHKVDKARQRESGVGLGLSIIRQILNQHGQTIWAQSNQRGNTFSFTLDIINND